MSAPVIAKPRARRRRVVDATMRQRIEAAIEAMINALDMLDAPTEDLEGGEPDEDDDPAEPSLGATEEINQSVAWRVTNSQALMPDGEIGLGTPGRYAPESQSQEFRDYRFGARDDREMPEDDEPSLGSVERRMDQRSWASGGDRDLEDEHDGREPDADFEPSLGSEEHYNWQGGYPGGINQSWWGMNSGDDREYDEAEQQERDDAD